jgi:hypothetical protein
MGTMEKTSKRNQESTMKKLTLFSLAISAAAVVLSPLALADNRNIDSPDSIEKEYQKVMQQEKDAKGMVDHDNPDYSATRKSIDNPDRIKEEYKEDMKRRGEAKKNAMPSEDSNPNYSGERKNIDKPEHIQKEYEKLQRNTNKPQE